MNWDAIGAIAELLGAIGVIASLVYLATQIRHSRDQMSQNTRALRSSSFHLFREEISQAYASAVAVPGLIKIVRSGTVDYDQLDDEDAYLFSFWATRIMDGYDNAHYQYRVGMLDEDRWEIQRAIVASSARAKPSSERRSSASEHGNSCSVTPRRTHMLDITTLAAWGEFIGGIAVVVSLIYLAGQIRQNSKLLRASTAAIRKESLTAPAILQAQDAELARIFEEGRADRGALSEDDRRRFDCLMTIMFAANNQHYEFVRDGLTTPDAGGEMDNLMLFLTTQPGARHWWREWKTIFPETFRNHTDGLIREGEAAE